MINYQEIVNLFNNHYESISSHLGYHVIPPENFINSMGNGFMYNSMPEKAAALFNLNIQNYPKNADVFEAMGDYYIFQSDTFNAIKQFKNVLKIDKNQTVEEKLRKLESLKL